MIFRFMKLGSSILQYCCCVADNSTSSESSSIDTQSCSHEAATDRSTGESNPHQNSSLLHTQYHPQSMLSSLPFRFSDVIL